MRGELKFGPTSLEFEWLGPDPHATATLVFLHEGLGSLSAWRDFPRELAARTGLSALVYSRQGYGGSSPCTRTRTWQYMHQEALRVLPDVLEVTGVQQAVLIGHSDGASIAAIFAGHRADPRLRALALMAPHFFVEQIALDAIAKAALSFQDPDFRTRLARHHGPNLDGAFWGWNEAWLSPSFAAWDIRSCLPGITCPVLLIQGEDDEYGTLEQVRVAEQGISGPVRTLMLPECGHSPWKAKRATVINAITELVSALGLVG